MFAPAIFIQETRRQYQEAAVDKTWASGIERSGCLRYVFWRVSRGCVLKFVL
jgi:hypothetical protein